MIKGSKRKELGEKEQIYVGGEESFKIKERNAQGTFVETTISLKLMEGLRPLSIDR